MSKAMSFLKDQVNSPPGPQGKHSSSFLGHTESSSVEQTQESGLACSSLQQGSVETSNKQGEVLQ